MVLQDVGSEASDSFSDGPAPSETDPYASSSTTPSSSSGTRFDDSQLRKPGRLLGALAGFSPSDFRSSAEQLIRFAEQKVHRPLTPEEAQALASHSYDSSMLRYRYAWFGTAAGAFRFYRTRAQNRFPFWTPPPSFIAGKALEVFFDGFSRQQARFLMQTVRLTAWLAAGNLFARGVSFVVAQPIAASGAAQDPRLAQFGIDLKAAQGGGAGGRPVERNPDGTPVLPPHAGAPRWPPPRRAPAPAPAPASTSDDSMSPSSSGDDWSSSGYGDESPREQQQPRSRPPPRAPIPPRQQPAQQDYDDMSPTGGLFEEEVQSQDRPGESTWDRLRRGQAPPHPQGPPPSRRPEHPRRGPPPPAHSEGNSGDSFTFADSDDERRRAQEQAQREFDARIERERHGRDFGGDERKW